MQIECRLEESYIDKVNETLTLEIYKVWKDKWGNYERLLASIPGLPYYQARSMAKAANTAKYEAPGSNVISMKFKLVEEI